MSRHNVDKCFIYDGRNNGVLPTLDLFSDGGFDLRKNSIDTTGPEPTKYQRTEITPGKRDAYRENGVTYRPLDKVDDARESARSRLSNNKRRDNETHHFHNFM